LNSRHEYRLFSENIPDFPVFMREWYLNAVCGEDGWDYIVFYAQSRILAVMPYWIRKKWGLNLLDMPPMVKFLGPIILPEFRTYNWTFRIYSYFIDRLPKVVVFRQNFNPTVFNWMPFFQRGYSQTTAYSFILNHQQEAMLWKGLNRNVRRNIDKARHLGVHILPSDDPTDIYYLQHKSFERQNLKPPFSWKMFKQVDDALKERKQRYIWIAHLPSGEKVAGAYLLVDGKTCYYHLSGELPEFRNSGAGILLLWKSILFAFEELKSEVFDFEGSMIKGVEAIRRQFGAEIYPYYKIRKNTLPVFRLFDFLKIG
jgi:hypothetical protein